MLSTFRGYKLFNFEQVKQTTTQRSTLGLNKRLAYYVFFLSCIFLVKSIFSGYNLLITSYLHA